MLIQARSRKWGNLDFDTFIWIIWNSSAKMFGDGLYNMERTSFLNYLF